MKTRNRGKQGFTKKQLARAPDEWIEANDACPRIIDEDIWQRIQKILSDPERAKQLPTPRFYMLRGTQAVSSLHHASLVAGRAADGGGGVAP